MKYKNYVDKGDRTVLISVTIPCYRSAKTLPFVVGKIREAFEKREGYDYQIILANDGSPDDTFEVIKKLCEEDKRIIGVNLSRNYGQAIAKYAALSYAEGEIVVCMDDDGQHPAEKLFELVDKVLEGYDVVYAKFPRKKAPILKRFTSWIHTQIMCYTIKKPKDLQLSSFYAISRLVADELKKYKSPYPATLAYMMHITTKIINVTIEHQERLAGKSGYNFLKRFNVWLDSFVSFSVVPLRFASFIGFIVAVLGFISGLGLIIQKIVNPSIAMGYTSTMSAILFVGGMIMIMLGLLGEYVGRMFIVMADAPQFVVRETINKKVTDNEENKK